MGRDDYQKEPDFYKDYKETNPTLVLGLIIISFGLYIINWIYLRNREFELINSNAPDSNRGAVILMILPFIWFFIYMLLKYLFFRDSYLILKIIELVGLGFITTLILKYLYDFCNTFGLITKTSGFGWFIFYLLGIIGIISIVFKFYYLSPLVFFLMIIIPAMQSELNSHFSRFAMKKKGKIFYS